MDLGLLQALGSVLEGTRTQYVLDHLGLVDVAKDLNSTRWRSLLDMVERAKVWVKLSAPYLNSATTAPYNDLQPFVESLAEANPAGMLWGTNWPHTQGTARSEIPDLTVVEPFRQEDDRAWLDTCRTWLERRGVDPAALDENAARVYGFV